MTASKNKPAMTTAEREHVGKVKDGPCAVCDLPGPCEAHEIVQGAWYLSISLCPDCHRNPILGWHGQKRAWAIRKIDELKALNTTLSRVHSLARARV